MASETMASGTATFERTVSQGECSQVYVDLDGTLIRSDLLLESALAFLRHAPLRIFSLVVWALRGRSYLKARLAEHFDLDPAILPYRTELISYLRELKQSGRNLVLATASDERLAQRVASHLGLFNGVLASSEANNLKGKNKHQAIEAHCGNSPYVYIGNDSSDLHIWKHAQAGVLVNATRRTADRARHLTNITAEFPREPVRLSAYIKAIRVYQWSKNLLLFVPLITAHLWSNLEAIVHVLFAAFAFSLCASSIYLINDLFDLSSDRAHPRKRFRPIAAGLVPIGNAVALSVALLLLGLIVAAQLSPLFLGVTVAYVVTTLAYSLSLKTYVLIDVITLAGLYTFRIIGGAVALAVVPSFWLLAFSMFIFLSLALVKRCSELQLLSKSQGTATRGRDYMTSDLGVVQTMGVASGFAAVQVFALYIDSDEVARQYSHPEMLWLLCGTILYWLGRMWIKTARDEMHDDPLLFAARDRGSLIMALLSMAIVFAAV
ncbi:MAG TPA: UbiA family prenyltransferase [Steroidobacter sp.]|uniref:UbiA family prenyltransferase n=1 Tax=Steroidobacter sp. TaxID=1978227 RepID=UPI002EDB40BB